MTPNCNYVARAFCLVKPENEEFKYGMRGALVTVVSRAESISAAVQYISAELAENLLEVEGFEYIFNTEYLDREISEYEAVLIARLDEYPIQFQNVHYFNPDG